MYVHRWAFIRLLYTVCYFAWTGPTGCNQAVQAIENLPIACNNNIKSKQIQLTTS